MIENRHVSFHFYVSPTIKLNIRVDNRQQTGKKTHLSMLWTQWSSTENIVYGWDKYCKISYNFWSRKVRLNLQSQLFETPKKEQLLSLVDRLYTIDWWDCFILCGNVQNYKISGKIRSLWKTISFKIKEIHIYYYLQL